MFFKIGKSHLLLVLLVLAVIYSRTINLGWGNGHFFHPDESNMATALSRISSESYNPHFFAYGQFPLYLGYGMLKVAGIQNTFSSSILVLRLISAIASVLQVLVVYKISSLLFPKKSPVILTIFTILSPGLIQTSHFGATEALLCLVFTLNIYLSMKTIEKQAFFYYCLIGLSTAIGLASKLSSLFFLSPLLTASLYLFVVSKNRWSVFLGTVFSVITALVFGVLLSFYSIIEFKSFLSSMLYETSVATGKISVFYTRQFEESASYLFQLLKVFPFTSGLMVYLLSGLGFVWLIFYFPKQSIKQKLYWLIIFIPGAAYFLYFGQLFVKWSRFISPVFFIPPLLVALLFHSSKHQIAKIAIFMMAVIPNIYFFKLYHSADVRVQASQWMDKHVLPEAKILSEAGNVVNLPIGKVPFNTVNFDFYNLDADPSLPTQLINHLIVSDYILVPSRRMFANQANSRYPVSQNYYASLFSGQLGFSQIAVFSISPVPFLNSEQAEETWSVFDHPTIRIYKKTDILTEKEYKEILLPNNFQI